MRVRVEREPEREVLSPRERERDEREGDGWDGRDGRTEGGSEQRLGGGRETVGER